MTLLPWSIKKDLTYLLINDEGIFLSKKGHDFSAMTMDEINACQEIHSLIINKTNLLLEESETQLEESIQESIFGSFLKPPSFQDGIVFSTSTTPYKQIRKSVTLDEDTQKILNAITVPIKKSVFWIDLLASYFHKNDRLAKEESKLIITPYDWHDGKDNRFYFILTHQNIIHFYRLITLPKKIPNTFLKNEIDSTIAYLSRFHLGGTPHIIGVNLPKNISSGITLENKIIKDEEIFESAHAIKYQSRLCERTIFQQQNIAIGARFLNLGCLAALAFFTLFNAYFLGTAYFTNINANFHTQELSKLPPIKLSGNEENIGRLTISLQQSLQEWAKLFKNFYFLKDIFEKSKINEIIFTSQPKRCMTIHFSSNQFKQRQEWAQFIQEKGEGNISDVRIDSLKTNEFKLSFCDKP